MGVFLFSALAVQKCPLCSRIVICDNSAMKYHISRQIDASGLLCPEPVMMLHNAVRDAERGAVIKLIATDPSTTRDIPKFCSYLGHALLEQRNDEQIFCYLIRKG